jgi:hypothetical protein
MKGVTDQLYLSMWLPQTLANWRVRYFEKMLSLLPLSQREQPQSTLTVHAVSATEPAIFERPFNGPLERSDVAETLKDYDGPDIAYRLETFWDLWLYNGEEWQVGPSRVSLSAFGSEFDNGTSLEVGKQEDLRIDFGVDSAFLPDASILGSGRLIESNIKSLLRLVKEMEEALPLERRVLETESGENFAEKLTRTLGGQNLTQ